MKILLTILLLSITTFSQMTYVGKTDDFAYYLLGSIQSGKTARFAMIQVKYTVVEDKTVLDNKNYLLSVFLTDCTTYKYFYEDVSGVLDGKEVTYHYSADNIRYGEAKSPSAIYMVIQAACKKPSLSSLGNTIPFN